MADDEPTTEFEAQSPLSVGPEEDVFAERPEAFVGAAFAGGLALALLLKRLAR